MKIKKNQKPTKIDAHFKYKCPNPDCFYDHWISLNETQTKHYKIVCDCGQVFQPKRIKKLKILYVELETQDINTTIIENCATVMMDYGFTKEESVELLTINHKKYPKLEAAELIKVTLKNLEKK